MSDDVLIPVLFFVAAALYSSVGHAGASGYLAVMALLSFAPESMKPTALLLNILVASLATYRYARAGYFSWQTFWPFVLGSIPLAFIGGALRLQAQVYKALVGVILLVSAARLVVDNLRNRSERVAVRPPPRGAAVAWGGLIGLLSGATGTGGGIFLSPLLLLMRWAETRQTAGVSAAFILANSISGLLGNLVSVGNIPRSIWIWAIAVLLGGLVGTELGTRKLAPVTLRYLLAIVLVVAGSKLIMG